MIETKPVHDDDIMDLFRRAMAGSEDASRRFLALYSGHLQTAVRRHLPQQLRSKFDSLDFVQDVWASFFVDKIRAQADRFEKPEALFAYLAVMARNKVTDAVRQRTLGQKHNVNRERSYEQIDPADIRHWYCGPSTPSEVYQRQEAWDAMLGKLPHVYRRVMILLRDGRDPDQICGELGVSRRTISRVIKRARQLLGVHDGAGRDGGEP